jgi:hypothetical protein
MAPGGRSEAQLDQAIANRGREQAHLENARYASP